MACEQCFVRGDKIFACAKSGAGAIERDSALTADEFDDEINLRLVRHHGGIVVPCDAVDLAGSLLLSLACADSDNLDAVSLLQEIE